MQRYSRVFFGVSSKFTLPHVSFHVHDIGRFMDTKPPKAFFKVPFSMGCYVFSTINTWG